MEGKDENNSEGPDASEVGEHLELESKSESKNISSVLLSRGRSLDPPATGAAVQPKV